MTNYRVGVTSANNVNEFFFDDMNSWIDIGFEELLLELKEQGIEDESDEWFEQVECNESIGPFLIGDWQKNSQNKYEINKNGPDGFAALFNADSNIITVEWSKITKKCAPTSPCYVMADGSGPCGDLDSAGPVVAYSLPQDYFSGTTNE